MRTIAGPLATHLATRSHTLCEMLCLVLRDGTQIGFTTHDQDLEAIIVEDDVGTVTYAAGRGMWPSDVAQSVGLDAGSFEVTGPLTEDGPITPAGVMGGRFNRATAYLFKVNWRSVGSGQIKMTKGHVGLADIRGGQFVFEIRDLFWALNQTVGSTVTPYCQGTHATCCVQIAPETDTTITSVSSALTFNIADTLDPDDHRDGRLWFTTGDLAGTEPREIYAIVGNTITLFAPLSAPPQVGDELTVKQGCDRTRATCLARFNNVIEFRGGYPETAGSDQILRMPIPGQGDQ